MIAEAPLIALVGAAAAGSAWGWLLGRPLLAGALILVLFVVEALALVGAAAALAAAAGGAVGALARRVIV